MKPSELLGAIALPKQDQSTLAFCNSAKTAAVRAWVENLQATKIMQTSAMLYKAAPQIARLKTDFQTRFEMLEALRPAIQNTTSGLEKTFLNQTLILPEDARKAVVVGQSLRKSMLDGYLAVAIQITENAKAKKQVLSLLGTAIHRAITNISYLFFRNYQIYTQPPASLWGTLHVVYQVADYYQLKDQPIIDEGLRSIRAQSISAAYTRVLMLAAAATNKLTQSEIETCFLAFENWCQLVNIEAGLSNDSKVHFVVNLLSNSGPISKQQLSKQPSDTATPANYLEIDFQALLNQLSKQPSKVDDDLISAPTIKVPKEFSANLSQHLFATWSNTAYRKQARNYTESSADICVGIRNVHYYICKGHSFDRFLSNSDNSGQRDEQELYRFSQGITPASNPEDFQSKSAPVHNVLIQNKSSGGYCLLWREDISSKVAAGELVAVKEIGQRSWNLGVIRWLRQLKNALQIGLKLVATDAKPCGIGQNYDSGGYSEYMRAFLIPPSKIGLDYPSILVASAPLNEFDTVRMIDGQKQWQAKLERVVFSTKSVQQFAYRNLSDAGDTIPPRKATSDRDSSNFDSTWDE